MNPAIINPTKMSLAYNVNFICSICISMAHLLALREVDAGMTYPLHKPPRSYRRVKTRGLSSYAPASGTACHRQRSGPLSGPKRADNTEGSSSWRTVPPLCSRSALTGSRLNAHKRPPNRPQPACTAESEKSVLNAQAAATSSPYDLRAGLRNAWCIECMSISLDIFHSLVLVELCAHVPGNGRRLQTGSPNAVKKTGRCQYAPVHCLLTETNGGA